MAELKDLNDLFNDSDLLDVVEGAIIVAAHNVVQGTPTAAQKKWAAAVAVSPKSEAKKALIFVIAANSAASIADIKAAGDPVVQNNVDAVVSVLVDAMAGV